MLFCERPSTLVSTAAQPTTDPASFDDVADFASYVQDTAPTGITLTLTPFQGAASAARGAAPGAP